MHNDNLRAYEKIDDVWDEADDADFDDDVWDEADDEDMWQDLQEYIPYDDLCDMSPEERREAYEEYFGF